MPEQAGGKNIDALDPQDALLCSEQRLQLAMEATDLGTFEWDIDADRITCSAHVQRLFGLHSASELKLADLVDRIDPEVRQAAQDGLRGALDAKGSRTYAGELRTVPVEGRTRWVDVRAVVLFGKQSARPQCMVGIVADITSRRVREEQLGRANRLKDDFMATLAHELRNPLTPLRNGIEILELTGLSHPSQQHACRMMERQLRHLAHLVDDLLDVTRIAQRNLRLKKAVVSLRRIVDAAVESVLLRMEASQHDLRIELPDASLLVEADAARLAQALGNVLNYSAGCTGAGGEIHLSATAWSDEVEIEIRDNGIGLAPEVLPHVFEMFAQGDSRTAASGIELAVTQALVEMHGGRITAESEGRGCGSTFRLWLPLAKPRHIAECDVSRPARRPSARHRVLVVDDDVDAADSTAALIGLMGHEVHQANDGLQAVRAAEQFDPELILMDISMPAMDGHEASRHIRRLPLPHRPYIVAVTGWSEDSERIRSEPDGIDAFVMKPVEAEQIGQILSDLEISQKRSSTYLYR